MIIENIIVSKKRNGIERLVGMALFVYIISTTAFENNPDTSALASVSLYAFLGFGLLYIITRKKIRINYYVIAGLIYGMLLTLSLIYTPDSEYGARTLYWYFTCMILVFIVVNYVDSREKIISAINAYILGGVVLSIFALHIYGWEVFGIASRGAIRIGGELGNENGVGMSCSYSVLFSFYMMLYTPMKKHKYVMYVIAIVCCFTLAILTGSKKALMIIIIGIVMLFMLKEGSRNFLIGKLKYIGIMVFIILLVSYVIQNVPAFWYINLRLEELKATLFGSGQTSESDAMRMQFISEGLQHFFESPIIGNGIASSRYFFGTYSHNNYIEILMNTGIIGFLVYYSSYTISLFRLIRISRRKDAIQVIALICLVVALILEMGLVDYYARYYQILFAIISGFVGTYCTRKGSTML